MTGSQDILYHEMLAALIQAQGIAMPVPADRCFWIAWDYWNEIKKITNPAALQNEKVAIEFFRNTKPAFTSQIQYFTMLSEAQLFIPADDEERGLYWNGELKRYRRFCNKNAEFVEYYDSGRRNLDRQYFLRSFEPITETRMRYDEDEAYCSLKDHLVRNLLAQRMYHEFVGTQLDLLKHK